MTDRYKALCDQLGYLPECRFVKLHRGGSVGFSCGKPQEIKELLRRVLALGLKPTQYLRRAAESR